ncbi:hypothetical protein UVI_02063720 [Ustilaginoidea virens]|uniref:Uncharacterized protein n=1 Tax=Ustilaginoidea virens TaxID=1159556 RepID=A0A1B5L8E4_USTVR|nr:hypothetical protein UVI_02063720 [Ustilaginoidea virens]
MNGIPSAAKAGSLAATGIAGAAAVAAAGAVAAAAGTVVDIARVSMASAEQLPSESSVVGFVLQRTPYTAVEEVGMTEAYPRDGIALESQCIAAAMAAAQGQ